VDGALANARTLRHGGDGASGEALLDQQSARSAEDRILHAGTAGAPSPTADGFMGGD